MLCVAILLLISDFQVEHLASHYIQGQYRNVKIVDSYAYFCTCRGLEIWDITEAANPQMLGSAATDGWATSVDVLGNYAYLAHQIDGLSIFDISNPTDPLLLGNYDSEGCTEYVMVQDTLAYLADGDHGLVIVSVADPSNPYYLGSWTESDYYSFTVHISDTIVYLGAISEDTLQGEPVKIINVADPRNPYLIVEFPQNASPYSNIVSAYVVDTLAFLVGGWGWATSHCHFLIADVSDPATPVLISTMNLGTPALGVTVAGHHAYVSNQDLGIRIIDFSNPVSPIEVGCVEAVANGYGCDVRDTVLIVPQSIEGFSIANVSMPSNPALLFHKPNHSYTTWAIDDNLRRLHLLGSVSNMALIHSTLSFVDISNLMSPIVQSQLNFLGSWHEAFAGPGLASHYPYLVFGLKRGLDDFLGVIDITDIDQPQLLRFEPGANAGPLAFIHPYVYAGHNDKMMIGDVNAVPFWTDSIDLPEFGHGMAVDDSIGYVACQLNLSIFNLNTGSQVTTYFHGHWYPGCKGGIMLDFPYLYMSFVAFYPGVLVYNGFLVFDVSNINSPLLIYQTWNLEPIPWYTWFTGHAKSCYIADTLFFLCSGRAGFDVYNITDPAAPNLVLTQNTPYSCDAIQVFNDTILVMDGLSLEVYRLVGTGIEETAVAHDRIGAVVIESYPDPFRNHMSIKYDLRNLSNRFEPILCFMNIYDVSGRLVKSIGNLTEHSGQITWYGKDDAGRDLPQGVYFVRLDAGDESYVRKVVMLR